MEGAGQAVIGRPIIVATTSIWADVVANVACDGLARVDALIPAGGDPHAFEPSLADRGRMDDAALIVANGLELEEGAHGPRSRRRRREARRCSGSVITWT